MPICTSLSAVASIAIAAGSGNPNILLIVWDDVGIDQATAFTLLQNSLRAIIESEPYCLGDGNRDRAVDILDVLGVINDWGNAQVVPGEDPAKGRGSFYDITQDGNVDMADLLADA
ncbi:MAG: dockerin type I domain-containing protein, partial [Phycisphaerales bacterium]|nr:dockerin type I domain-containing protein [Phycisphaerales bacterium]